MSWIVSGTSGCTSEASEWDCVNDNPNDGDTTYIRSTSSTNPTDSIENLGTVNFAGASVSSVVVNLWCRRITADTVAVRTLIKTNGNLYEGGSSFNCPNSATYGTTATTYTTNPQTGLAWTQAQVDALQAGCRDKDATTRQVRCSEVRVDVNFNPRYALEIRFAWSGVPMTGDSWTLAVECQRLNPGAENVLVQVGQGGSTPALWRTAYTCSSDTDQAFNTYKLSPAELNYGAPVVRIWDNQQAAVDSVQGTAALDVLRIDRFMGAGPRAPPPTQYAQTPYQVPYADLHVLSIRSDRGVVAPSQLVVFTVEAENVGFLTADLVNLTLYDNLISNSTAIAWTLLDMTSFQAKTFLTWFATGLGAHTIIAFIDANYTYQEISETNNTASTLVQVSVGGGPGVPDAATNERDVGLSSEPYVGVQTSFDVETHNSGTAAASNLGVRVQDNGATIDSYTILSLSAGGSYVRTVVWTPASAGLHLINVTLDEGGVISELNESNNFMSTGVGVAYPVPGPTCLFNGIDIPTPVFRDEYVVPAGESHVYAGCLIYATNVTVYGSLRLLTGSRLVVGKLYPIPPGGTPTLRLLPNVAWHSVRVEPAGLMEVVTSTIQAKMAAYAFGFEAKLGSAFHMNSSFAYGPWGPYGFFPLPGSVGEVPGGLIVRTPAFTFRQSTVALGRTHGLFLDGVIVPSPGLIDDVFGDNRAMGLVALNSSQANVSNSQFLRNSVGFYQKGKAPSGTSVARIESSLFQANQLGVDSDVRSSINVTGNTGAGKGFLLSKLMAIRLTWRSGMPIRKDPIVSNLIDRNLFGVYARRASPEVRSNTFQTALGIHLRTHVTLDQSLYVSQSGQEWPRVVSNQILGVISAPFEGHGVIAISTNVLIRSNTMTIPQSVSCIATTCRMEGNPVLGCWGIAAVALSNLSWTAGNSIAHLGCGATWGIRVDTSSATLRDGIIGQSETLLDVFRATALQVVNVTFSDLDPVSSGESDIAVKESNAALFENNRMLNAPIAIFNSQGLTFRRNYQRSDAGNGIELTNDANALVEYNTFESPFRYTPENQPITTEQRDRGHVKVYNNATATVRWNVLRNGSWGVSVDDTRLGPLTLPFRSTYALVQNNWINDSGYVAVGVNSTTRGDILNNWVSRSVGWSPFMESSFAGNRIENNTVNDCHGISTDAGYGGCVRVSKEGLPGQVVVANNTIARGNATGIYVPDDYSAVIRDNTVSNVTGKTVNEIGECVKIASAIAVPVVRNTLRDCRIGIWILKGTGHDLARNTVQNTTVANVTWGLRLDGTGGAVVWANVHDNNTFTGWTYGVWIDAQFVDPNVGKFRLWWSDVRLNLEGVHVQGNPTITWGANKYFHAECSWWNSNLGPHDPNVGNPDTNINPAGQVVSDFFHYRTEPSGPLWWLKSASSTAITCAP